MDNTDYAYAAGYIDGDGCFQIGNQRWGSHLVIVSIRERPIMWFAKRFDGSIRVIQPRTKNRTPSYHFRFSEKGLKHLPYMHQFLIEKKRESSIFTEFRECIGEDRKKPLIQQMKNEKNNENLIPFSIKKELESLRNTITPTKEDFAYLAGFIDAECSLDINRTCQKGSKFFTFRAQIQCNNTKSPFFYWVSQRFGGQFHFLDKGHIPNCRNQILWRVSNKKLDAILDGILPFLTSKKPICELLIESRKLVNNKPGRCSPNSPDYKLWNSKVYPLKESVYQKVRQLNNSI